MSAHDFYYDLYSQQWEYATKVRPPIVIDLTEDVIDLTEDNSEISYTHTGTIFIDLTKEDLHSDCSTYIGRRPGEFLFMLIYFFNYVIIFCCVR